MDANGHDAWLPAANRAQAEAWALVLAAEGIPNGMIASDGRFFVAIDAGEGERARRLIESWIRENTAPAKPEPVATPDLPTNAGIWIGIALCAFFLVTGPWSEESEFFRRGSADARRILNGELWRTITALTLHSDAGHVLGNAFSCGVFGTLLLRRYGVGVGVWLLLGSGTLGNLLTALWHGSMHRSVGASTALFGAMGALVATELARRRRHQLGWNRAWLPIAAGVGLLAMLGTGEGSDLIAHLMGLLSGVGLGLFCARAFEQRPPRSAQTALALAALGSIALAWLAALG